MPRLYDPNKNVVYSPQQLAQFAANAGFRGQQIPTIVGIAVAESGGNSQAYNPVGRDTSFGVLQINAQAHGMQAGLAALDPQNAFNFAYKLSGKGSDFSPWTTYTSGDYQQHATPTLANVQPGTDLIGSSGGINFTADPTMSFNPGFTDFTKGTVAETSLGGTFSGGYTRDGSGNIVWASGDTASGNVGANFGAQGEYGVGQFLPSGQEVLDTGATSLPFLSDPLGAAKDILGGGANSNDNQWWQKLLINIQDLSIRAGLGLLALVLIAAGAWAFASGSAQEELRKLARVSK